MLEVAKTGSLQYIYCSYGKTMPLHAHVAVI